MTLCGSHRHFPEGIRFVERKIFQGFAGVVGYNLNFAVAIHIPGAGSFHIANVGNVVNGPRFPRWAGVLQPAEHSAKPTARYYVLITIAIHIQRNSRKVVVIFIKSFLVADEFAFSERVFSFLGIVVPEIAGDQIGFAVLVHIHNSY